MPYNNTPITPTEEVKGTVSLPLARVKKIINADPDIAQCSNNAAFMITVATEMFLQHLVDQSFNQVKTEHTQKPRRNIQYRDVSNAVARVENLEFLTDVVPRTMTYKQAKAKQMKETVPAEGTTNGQHTLDSHLGPAVVKEQESDATNGGAQVHIPLHEHEREREAAPEAMDVDESGDNTALTTDADDG